MTEHGSDIGLEQSAETAPPASDGNDDNGGDEPSGACVIDPEALIAEVKKYPILYSNAQTEYLEKTCMQKGWQGVCQGLFEQWNTFCPRKKKDTVKEIQNKWHKLKESFFKSCGGVRKTSSVGKNKKTHHQSMSFLVANPVDMASTYNQMLDQFTPLVPSQVQNMETPLTAVPVDDFVATYDPKKTFYIPATHPAPSVPPEQNNPNTHFALMLVPLLSKLSREQQYSAWPEILRVIKEAEGQNKISVLQKELIYPSRFDGLTNIVQPNYYPQSEVALSEPVYPSSSSTSQLPSSRPTNPQGELIYPETDNEEDEV